MLLFIHLLVLKVMIMLLLWFTIITLYTIIPILRAGSLCDDKKDARTNWWGRSESDPAILQELEQTPFSFKEHLKLWHSSCCFPNKKEGRKPLYDPTFNFTNIRHHPGLLMWRPTQDLTFHHGCPRAGHDKPSAAQSSTPPS